jgi:CRISPR/Cas system CSM-associated protein Csm3 (group 7 of RAMP superfamily)
VPQESPRRQEPTKHERFTGFTGKLELTFTVVSEYLFVGSGGYEFDPNHRNQRPDVWYTFYRRNGQICIPGTSIKGAIRSIIETISNSCVSQSDRAEDVHKTHNPCRAHKRNPEKSQLCPACRLFGVTGFRGRVHFADALPVEDATLKIVKIGDLHKPDPKKHAGKGRKFYEVKQVPTLSDPRPQQNFRFVEALPKGTRFQTTLHFENLTEGELGLLAWGLGWQVHEGRLALAFPPKLGGAKPRCFGAVEFRPKRILLWQGSAVNLIQKYEPAKEDMLRLIMNCMGKASKEDFLLDEESWKKLRDGMRTQDSTCPQGVY